MTEQEFMQFQSRLRAIAYDASAPKAEREKAERDLKALAARYKVAFSPLRGSVPYTDDGRFDK